MGPVGLADTNSMLNLKFELNEPKFELSLKILFIIPILRSPSSIKLNETLSPTAIGFVLLMFFVLLFLVFCSLV